MLQEQYSPKPEMEDFPVELLDSEGTIRLAERFSNNRNQLIAQADELGLAQSFLERTSKVIVGPFVGPAPLATIYQGHVNNIAISTAIGSNLAASMQEVGIIAQQQLIVPLALTEVPVKTQKGTDVLVVPKNKGENQKILLTANLPQQTLYGEAIGETFVNDKQKNILQESFFLFLERYPQIKKLGKQAARSIFDALQTDITEASCSSAVNKSYLAFSAELNQRMARRARLPANLPITCVDTHYYSPFLRYGIQNIGKFASTLEIFQFFEDNPGFVKFKDSTAGKMRILKVTDIGDEDIMLQDTDGFAITYTGLLASQIEISPCKELAYFLAFSNLVPVVYGDENMGDYYAPYAKAKRQVGQLGCEPNLYRIQPWSTGRINDSGTVFDFYTQALFPDLDYK